MHLWQVIEAGKGNDTKNMGLYWDREQLLSKLHTIDMYLLQKMEEQMTKGAVLFIKGLSKETTMEEVKTFFGDYGNVAWVEYAKGDEKVSQISKCLLGQW